MLKWAIIFAVISVVAGFLGFGGVSQAAGGVAKILFFVFVAIALLFVLLLLAGVQAIF